jgi:hypothetical protein
MDRHERAAKIAELSREIKTKEAELDALLGGSGEVAKSRAPQKCGKCGEEGHSARTCPNTKVPTLPLTSHASHTP